MIKGIIFDFGGVMKNETDPFIFQDIAQDFKVKPLAVKREAKKLIPLLHKGRISDHEFLKRLARKFKVEFKPKEMGGLLDRSYHKKSRLRKPMAALVIKLNRNYKTLLFSNTFNGHARLNQRNGWYDGFQKKLLSHKVGLTKPDKRIYRLALKKIGLKAGECVFIDDKKVNLKPARELGIKALHFKDYQALKKDLKGLGVKLE